MDHSDENEEETRTEQSYRVEQTEFHHLKDVSYTILRLGVVYLRNEGDPIGHESSEQFDQQHDNEWNGSDRPGESGRVIEDV